MNRLAIIAFAAAFAAPAMAQEIATGAEITASADYTFDLETTGPAVIFEDVEEASPAEVASPDVTFDL